MLLCTRHADMAAKWIIFSLLINVAASQRIGSLRAQASQAHAWTHTDMTQASVVLIQLSERAPHISRS